MAEKVYCENCEHLRYKKLNEDYHRSTCNSPRNMKWVDNWLNISFKSDEVPWKLNSNNDCKYYEHVIYNFKRDFQFTQFVNHV